MQHHHQRKCSFTPKKRRVIKEKLHCFLCFSRFQQFCLSQTKLPNNTAILEIGSITNRCSGKEPVDKTQESGGNRA